MDEIRECLLALGKDPEARKLLLEMKEPGNTNMEEMAGLYAAIAEKRGVSLSKDQVLQFLKEEQERVRKLTEKAEEQIGKMPLAEESLDHVAGGAGGDHNECESTFVDNEWCWISDACSLIISSYDKPSGAAPFADDAVCANNMFGTTLYETNWTQDDEFSPSKGSYWVLCVGSDM